MKIFKSKYKLKNTTGGYDTVHFETSAEQVVTNNLFQFVTEEEKANWNNKVDINHTHKVEDFVGLDFNALNVSIEDTETLLEATNVEEALAEIVKKTNTNASNIGSLQNELGTNKSTLEANINGIREVL